ncbi:MspA family porin [Gordonia sp. L191]|uniref:MspA family porin n=1 Tax=Gordonia sp. L191 TaxID=2982699 RepID=UPI0024BF227C|nr:MspA family porin [Gordonia sp. L191]WHU49351.1 MspA family porin [Gordonia sp. L191]
MMIRSTALARTARRRTDLAPGVLAVLAAVMALSASMLGAGSSHAATFADRQVSKVTDDGWRVTAIKSQEQVRSVPPLNQSSWTREGFLSLKGEAVIAGTGSVPIQSGTLATGFQIGCNTDVTSGATIGVSGGPSANLNVSYPPAVTIGATVTPNIATTLRPGTIADIPFGSKKLQTGKAGITADGVHVKVDGCLGPVAVRAYVTVAISTALNDNTINVYGQPHYL